MIQIWVPGSGSATLIEITKMVDCLERLYDHYPKTFPCKILLSENYRNTLRFSRKSNNYNYIVTQQIQLAKDC